MNVQKWVQSLLVMLCLGMQTFIMESSVQAKARAQFTAQPHTRVASHSHDEDYRVPRGRRRACLEHRQPLFIAPAPSIWAAFIAPFFINLGAVLGFLCGSWIFFKIVH